MAAFPPAAFRAVPSRVASPTRTQAPSTAAGLSRRAEEAVRPVQVSALRRDGSRVDLDETVPVLPAFDEAFLGFARGTLLHGVQGEIAVEDLVPGNRLRTSGGRMARITWIGRTLFPVPADGGRPLIGFMPDCYGFGRPNGFLSLGPSARILQTPPHLRRARHPGMLTPAHAFVDAVSVVEVRPPAPVELFHIMLDHHAVVQAGGLDCESLLPDQDVLRSLRPEHRARFLSLFPMISDLAEFGPPTHPRPPAPDV